MTDNMMHNLDFRCQICGSVMEIAYASIMDNVFCTEGKWDFYRCKNHRCRTVSIRPLPTRGVIENAYNNYYTHINKTKIKSPIRQMYDCIKKAYVKLKYGYDTGVSKYLGFIMYLFPERKAAVDYELLTMRSVKNGRLLDIGCGNGNSVSFFQSIGWASIGIDSDSECVKLAISNGINAKVGEMNQNLFENDTFEAVTMIHLIEHIQDPLPLLIECRKVLTGNGKIYILTPNIESFGHSFYKQSWRGLEPPRHLNIYTEESMDSLLKEAGFKKVKVKTLIAPQILYASQVIRENKHCIKGYCKLSIFSEIFVKLLTIVEMILLLIDSRKGDAILAIAEK